MPISITPLATLGEAYFLVSPWKPVLLLIPFVAYLWLNAKVFDKFTAQYFLAREQWNLANLGVAVVALAVAIFLPMRGELAFWVALVIVVALLAGNVAFFVSRVNKDERVPEGRRLRLDFSKFEAAKAQREAAKKQGKVELLVKDAKKQLVAAPNNDTPEFAARVAAEQWFIKALEARASQVDVGPAGGPAGGGAAGGKDASYAVTALVDGVRVPLETLPAQNAIALLDLWRAWAGHDVADHRKRQVGDLTAEKGVDRKTVRVISQGAQGGVRGTLLFDPAQAVRRKAEALGLLEAQVKEAKAIAAEEKGLVLLAGPADGGRTTTLYTFVKMHDAYTKNVLTLEVDPQDDLEGVKQNKFEPTADGPDFSTQFRSIIRRDPDVVGVGDLVDQQTAKEVSKIEVDRVRVYLSLRADSALSAVQTWMKAVGDNAAAAKVLHGVSAQKLVRKLCMNCRQAYAPSPDMLKKLGIPADKAPQFFKKGGQVILKNGKPDVCPVCRGVGYVGQEGVFEVYPIGQPERDLIAKQDFSGLKAELRKKGLPTIQQAAIAKAVSGVTSIEEVIRVTTEGAPAAAAAAPGAAVAAAAGAPAAGAGAPKPKPVA